MITSLKEAQTLAEKMVTDFANKYEKEIKANRLNGDTLGVTEGTPIYRFLEETRREYLKQVDPAITYDETTNYFNIAAARIILKTNE